MKIFNKNPKGGGGEEHNHNSVKTASLLILTFVFALMLCGAVSAENVTNDTVNDTTTYTTSDSGTSNDTALSGSDCLPTVAHGTIQGEVYISSTAGWPGSNPDNFEVPEGTVVYARYYVGVWSGLANSTFNGYDLTAEGTYVSGMGVTWIAYDVTDYVIAGALNTATSSSYGGDGRQYGNTIVVVLQNDDDPYIEYWITEGMDWLVGEDAWSYTTLEGTVDLSNVQNASLYSVLLTGYGSENLNGNTLPTATEHVSGGYFDAIRYDNIQELLVSENQSVNVLGDGDYTSLVFHALTITYNNVVDLKPVELTPTVVVPETSNTLTATIANNGAADASSFNVSLLVDGTVVDTQSVAGLAGGSSTTVDFQWTPGTEDSYTLTVNVDPENTVDEGVESNNSLDVVVGTSTAPVPVADFTADTTSDTEPLTVTFTDESSNGPTEWLWDFGDGTTSTEQNPTHIYTIPGTYTVTLTATNVAGSGSTSKTDYITVKAVKPVASFTADTTNIVASSAVQFTDTSTHYPTSWIWEFGDGTTSTEQNPTHTYTSPGTYTVKLAAINTGGVDTEEKTNYITVYIAPVADFTASTTSGNGPLTVNFTDQSTNVPTEWLWDFGDGTTSTSQNPTHTYTLPGTYTVTLTATNLAGTSTTTLNYITVPEINDGPVWTRKSEWDTLDIGTLANPCLADLDGDGDYDLLIAKSTGVCLGYENTGTNANPVWTAKSEWDTTDIGGYAAPALADLDGDGDYDLLIGYTNGGRVYAYENTGTINSPMWTRKSEWDLSGLGSCVNPYLADLDGDGDYDLLIGNTTGVCYAYENTGTTTDPIWTAKSEWNTAGVGSYAAPTLADLDDDGDYDLLIGERYGVCYAYENTAPSGDPDLTPTSIEVPTLYVDTPCTITATVSNNGTGDVGAFVATLSVDGVVVDTQNVSGPAAGSTSTVNFTWTPTTLEAHTFTVTVDSVEGIVELDETNNTMIALPVTEFSADVTSGDPGLTVNFTDQSSNGPAEWLWDFGDGTTSNEQNPTHNYTDPGTYTVTLTTTNAGGSSTKEKTDYITVYMLVPVAEFTADNTIFVAPYTVQFTDQSTTNPSHTTSWLWVFGDGTTSTEQNPTHTYTTAGEYTVTLVVSNEFGFDTEEKTKYITVYIPPVSNFTVSTTSGDVPLTVTFTDESSNSPTEWLWDFGDGTTSTSQNPKHTYTLPGTYAVTLTATNMAGTSTATSNYITTTRPIGPTWTANSEWDTPDVGKYSNPVLADLDGDGDYDLLIGAEDGVCYGYENTGTTTSPVWTRKSEWDTTDVGSYAAPAFADLDGDGDYDLLIGASGGVCYGYENTGTTTSPVWTAKTEWDTTDVGSYAAPAFADLDGDGDYDLLIGEGAGAIYGYENTGTANSPVWTVKTEWNMTGLLTRTTPALGDLDGDGDYDLLIGLGYAHSVWAYENTGTINNPIWTKKSEWTASNAAYYVNIGSGYYIGPALADLDVDGDYDLLMGSDDGVCHAYENVTFTESEKPDLIFSSVNLPSSINVGTPCTVTATVSNNGTVDVGAFVATLSVDGVVVDTQNVIGPAVGSTSTVIFNWIPDSEGVHSLLVTVDSVDGITESDETNNTITVDATVKMALPVAEFSADNTSVSTVDSVQFTDESTNSATEWTWDFGDGYLSTTQNPTHTYTLPGTYTVTLTVTNESGSDTVEKTDYITVVDPFDVEVTGVNCQQSTVFAGEDNTVTITIANNGSSTATDILVNLYASDVDDSATVVATTTIDSLESGASTTVTMVDPTVRAITADTEYESTNVSYVNYTATADPDDNIPESDENNNTLVSEARPVYYNGYKGKRYEYNGEDATSSETNTSGDINTEHVYDIQGDVVYSSGDSSYHSVGWTSSTSTWTTTDLSVPNTASLEDVWLYVAYNWDTTSDGNPDWTVTFNGTEITPVALYTDQKNFAGTWALYKYGLYV